MLNHHSEQHAPHETARAASEVVDGHGNRATFGNVAFCRIYDDGAPEKPESTNRVVNLPEVVSRFNRDGHESTRPKTLPAMPWMIEQWLDVPLIDARTGRKVGQGSWEPVTGFLTKPQCDLWLALNGNGKRYRVRNCTKQNGFLSS